MKKKGRIGRALHLTRLGMIWERAARAFWPLAGLLACFFAIFAFGGVAAMPVPGLLWLVGGALIALLAAAIWGGLRYRHVRETEVVERLDRTLPGRPLTALRDRAAIGGEGELWQAHLTQMQERAAVARAVRPDAGLTRRDPYALRLAALVALVMALIFGGTEQMGQGVSALAATISRPAGQADDMASGPTWEGWAKPPDYTRRPTIYLNALPEGEMLTLPKGSVISFRQYDEESQVTQDIGAALGDEIRAGDITAENSGTFEIAGRRFEVTVLPDQPPVIRAGDSASRRADGRMVQPFEAEDDHGVVSAKALISLDMENVSRQYGLAVEPEPREAIALELPLPRSGDPSRMSGQLVEDLSRHPWANLPVRLSLQAVDGIGQEGTAEPESMVLPGRRFFDPLAAALIEIRRDLLWSRENAKRSAEILRAVTWQPQGFVEEGLYLQLRGAVRILEAGPLDEAERDKLAEALWKAAVQLEDGGLADALERMKQAQEKLSEAIRNGASPDEVQRLMNELKEATDAYTQMLAEQGKADPAERFTKNQERQQITGDQIQQMMDEIQRLMNEGRMAEAQQLLEQFNRMMENLQVTNDGDPNGSSDGQGNRSMNGLADTLREQQRLSDEAFREMQEQFGRGEGESSGNSEELAQRQRELREELGQQRGLLPGEGTQQGDDARQRLDDAGRAMEDAEESLRNGDPGGAMQRQADAIQSMREGMRALGDMLGQDGQRRTGDDSDRGQEGSGSQSAAPEGEQRRSGQSDSREGQSMLDPLGREQSSNGNVTTPDGRLAEGEIDPAARARSLLDEIRRRSGDQERPRAERDYLERLLDRF
ncbi:DUF4175 family protein [Paracoccus onubensis]|uniref:DUF4175 domain-containing protein n=1 Tax=Paracoccus onubensis TaxID=1675788 RepID=UPI0027320230|nr:DUF4175 family protein [Paracoccus onubensis]MDP0927509.1 DUF4175 family protein [Paracoccus onubensis]